MGRGYVPKTAVEFFKQMKRRSSDSEWEKDSRDFHFFQGFIESGKSRGVTYPYFEKRVAELKAKYPGKFKEF